MGKIISGIQQIGLGIPNVHDAFKWYRQNFGMDIPVFEEAAEANLMLPYTGGKPHKRHAILAINLQGGGGFEIWQYTSRKTEPANFELQLGDYGIFVAKIKSRDVKAAYRAFKDRKLNLLGELQKDPQGNEHFFVKDPHGMIFQVVKGNDWFSKTKSLTGGPNGCIIGVSDIEKARKLYSDILGFDHVIYDKEDTFSDFADLPGGQHKCRRVLLRRTEPNKGGFSRLLGSGEIELVKVYGRMPRKIFENRYWGDAGFIHLCFDIIGMKDMQKECEAKGFPFTVDSSQSFDMGEAAGHFSYVEDPDGTLIEFVETHKIPVIKKIGWYLDVRKRNPEKPLPDWMLKALQFNRVKD